MAESDSVEAVAPYLAQQWHPTLNRGLRPSQVQVSRSRLVWWLGPCGHSWQESPSRRVRKGADCPVCTGDRLLADIKSRIMLSRRRGDVANSRPGAAGAAFRVAVAAHFENESPRR